MTLDKLALKPDGIFLEIGCGGGLLMNLAIEDVSQVKAIEHSPDMVKIAQISLLCPNLPVLPSGYGDLSC